MLTSTTRDIGDVTVLDLKGSLISGPEVDVFKQRIDELVGNQKMNVVVNAEKVSVIDSSGTGALVVSFNRLKKSGGTLKVANPSQFVRESLQTARIFKIIEIHDTEEAAVKSFADQAQ